MDNFSSDLRGISPISSSEIGHFTCTEMNLRTRSRLVRYRCVAGERDSHGDQACSVDCIFCSVYGTWYVEKELIMPIQLKLNAMMFAYASGNGAPQAVMLYIY
jgi:hypothetical protein